VISPPEYGGRDPSISLSQAGYELESVSGSEVPIAAVVQGEELVQLMTPYKTRHNVGAMVISLDFELHWGVRDHAPPNGPYRENLDGARAAIPAMLRLFEEFDVRATWATVGFLFAQSRDEIHQFTPQLRPSYERAELSPYAEPLGAGEADDPIHYAPSLVDLIAAAPGQEIATHTFSHYYCLEPGQDEATFSADLESAIAIADRRGIRIRSIVFPRNQFNPEYAPVLRRLGLTCYRGNQSGSAYRAAGAGRRSNVSRARRIVNAYVGPARQGLVSWDDVRDRDGLHNVPASCFLRPYSRRLAALEPVRLRRISTGLESAAKTNQLFHLWWHPHNFGVNLEQNMGFLRQILERYSALRTTAGMSSMNMSDVADAVAARSAG
jgi:peptidoglycan/xylan/chitin deacetylase (PgdA/CDA1 family)